MRTKTVRTHRQTDTQTDTQTDRHTPLTTIPDGLRRAGNDDAARIEDGKPFQARAAATGKARSTSVTRLVDGTISVDVAADRRRRRASTSSVDWRRVSAR